MRLEIKSLNLIKRQNGSSLQCYQGKLQVFFLTVLEDKYIGGQSRPIGKVKTRRRSIDKIKVTLPFKYQFCCYFIALRELRSVRTITYHLRKPNYHSSSIQLRSWEKVMQLHKDFSFNLNWSKQLLAFQLLALLHAKKKKFKTGLKAIYQAQTIVAAMDETVERNLDYLMAVNTLTAYLLLQI